ncbi:Oidioi.mRNA.OKI2018_I69.chr1.g1781.t2.cds [Oikopleura dioica]|uniref:Oidioi.mRNA.OKI2018_I69.chr1.g1781.t2.cds n=1 Tax=Oikopleura dioica TaxID=34765 RepID=A0ABN7SP01_OIKDI|nr:Oidioi.mRNA.OKI2018_I69.chr1.g1781.t2.cds [Oikopleura dioica]
MDSSQGTTSVMQVEVRFEQGGWAAGGQIVDYDTDAQTVSVLFNQEARHDFPVTCVRPALPPSVEVVFVDGDSVDIYYQPSADKPGLWYPGVIDKCKGDFYKCKFLFCGNETSDVFEYSNLRTLNTSTPLSSEDFHKCQVVIPEELHAYCENNPDAHRDFAKACEAMSVRYHAGRIVVLSRKDVSRRVDMISEFHLKNLHQKKHLAERVVEAQKALEQSKLVAESCSEKFNVDPDLLKFVVGHKGVNIQKARAVPGVIQINIDDEQHAIHIYADNAEAAAEARHILEYTEEHYLVPRPLVGRIIGQKGKSIQDIIDKSHVIKVRVLSEEDATNIPGAQSKDVAVFKFIGTRINNQNAVVLMDYLVQSLREIDELQDEQYEIEKQIKTYQPFVNTYPYFQEKYQDNNTSGYSSAEGKNRGDGPNNAPYNKKPNNFNKGKQGQGNFQKKAQPQQQQQQQYRPRENQPGPDGWNTVIPRGPYARAVAGENVSK